MVVAVPNIQFCLFLAKIFVGMAFVSSAELMFESLEGSDGLCSPRKLAIHGGEIYVAESGYGPEVDPVMPNETDSCFLVRGLYTCVGSTARVSKLPLGGEDPSLTVVIEGLFSAGPLAALETNEGSEVTGAHSVGFDSEGNMYTVIGLGLNGTVMRETGIDVEYGDYGAILKGEEVVALPWESEFEFNYDGSSDPTGVLPVPDSNPYHILISGSKYHVVDAGCNCVMTYDMLDQTVADEPSSVLVIPMYTGLLAIPNDQPGPCMGVTPPMGPPFCGMYEMNGTWFYDTEPSPTSLAMRPGVPDKIYLSTLTGALWTEPIAQILEYALDADGNPTGNGTEVAGGFWAIVDFTFHGDDTLYVLELKPAGFVPFEGGRLTKVNLEDGTSEVVAESDQLFNPTGIAIDGDMLYLTNNTLMPCNGHIIRASLASVGEEISMGEGSDGFPEETSPDEDNGGSVRRDTVFF